MTADPADLPVTELFAQITDDLARTQPGIDPTRMFGSPGLNVHNKTFAMLVKGHLVVKLPRVRVDQLAAAGAGERFDPGHGRTMREWITVTSADPTSWRGLVTEALAHVSATNRHPGR
jgi:TfoX N-terminal domain